MHAAHPDCPKVDHQISPEIQGISTSATFKGIKSIEDLGRPTNAGIVHLNRSFLTWNILEPQTNGQKCCSKQICNALPAQADVMLEFFTTMGKQPPKNARTIRLCSNPMDPKKKPRRHSGGYDEDVRWLKFMQMGLQLGMHIYNRL